MPSETPLLKIRGRKRKQKPSPQASKVGVSARKNLVTWDKDYAQQLLEKIVKQK